MAEYQKEALHRDGFTTFPQLFSSAEMDELRLKSEAVLFRTNQAHRERFRANGSLCNIAELPEFSSLLAHPRVLDAIREVGGEDIRWTSGYLISKPPGGAPLFWHQDWWGWDSPISYGEAPAQLFVMIYLTDTRVENGCLRVIPGSHREAHSLHTLPAAHTRSLATQVDEAQPAYASHDDERAVPVRRGDVVIGDSRLLHSAYANRTDEERPLLTLWYIPNWRSLPANVQATLQDIYGRRVVDIDEADEELVTCESWPAIAYNRIKHLVPDYCGNSAPLPWNRIADAARMVDAVDSEPRRRVKNQ